MSTSSIDSLLSVFARASELGRGQAEGHVHRATWIAMATARELGLKGDELAAVYFTSLLAHCGCTAGISQMAAFIASDEIVAQRDLCLCDPNNTLEVLGWMKRNAARTGALPTRAARMLQMMFSGDKMVEAETGCSDVGARIGTRLGLPAPAVDGLRSICETWSGKGPRRLAKTAIPLSSRIAHAAMVAEVFHHERGPSAALETLKRRAGRSLDPEVIKALAAAAQSNGLWDELGRADLAGRLAALAPRHPRAADETFLDDAAVALADFVDLKAPLSAAHSRAVATLSEQLAERLGLPADERATLRRAALLHDLGLMAIPSFVLQKSALNKVDHAQIELHPQHLQRLLAPVEALAPAVRLAACLHERLDGSGYPLGLKGDAIPVAARILAVADAYDEATRGFLREAPLPAEAARAALQAEAGRQLDADCVRALAELTAPAAAAPWKELPGGLTARQLEVLRLAARGLALKEIAAQLSVSPHTARHHLEAVYEKLGISSRAGATLFAMEHGLLE